MTPGKEVELRDFVGQVIAKAGIQPAVRVISAASNAPLSAAEVHVFDAGGGVRLVGVTRSIQANQEGIGGTETIDNAAFEKTEPVKIVFEKPVQVYDQRAGKYLGKMDCSRWTWTRGARRSWCWPRKKTRTPRRDRGQWRPRL